MIINRLAGPFCNVSSHSRSSTKSAVTKILVCEPSGAAVAVWAIVRRRFSCVCVWLTWCGRPDLNRLHVLGFSPRRARIGCMSKEHELPRPILSVLLTLFDYFPLLAIGFCSTSPYLDSTSATCSTVAMCPSSVLRFSSSEIKRSRSSGVSS